MRFEKLKNDILGKKYSLSIAFVSARKSQEINKKYRKKDKPTNVLSFAYDKNEGELILCNSVIRSEAKNFGRSFENFLGFLVIHGMLHLKGMEHGSKMDRAEAKYDKKYFYRDRPRLRNNARSRGRVSKGRSNS